MRNGRSRLSNGTRVYRVDVDDMKFERHEVVRRRSRSSKANFELKEEYMKVNGKEICLKPGTTILNLLEELKLKVDNVVVEVNLDIIENHQYSTYILKSDDIVEVIRFVGGG
ncbi:sulfur carrier protein ThiS [Bacillus sp. BAU-SS-2023]|nr:sulfur carrier protein ThiS [Bacillus sp. BAU-SS-2023]